MTKRQKFVISSLILTSGFLFLQFVDTSLRYQVIAGFTAGSFVLSFWSLKEGLGRNATLLVLTLPTFFTAAVGLFYFLLPPIIFVGIPVLILYAIGIYALLLTANIYTVAAARTIALLRAAHAVGFVLALVTAFLLFDTLLSLRSSFLINGTAAGLLSFPLLLQGFWSVDLESRLSEDVLYPAIAVSVVIGQMATILSFWPVTVTVGSLALTTLMYVGLGLGQARLQQRLFGRTVKEYFTVGAIVFLAMFLTAKWGG